MNNIDSCVDKVNLLFSYAAKVRFTKAHLAPGARTRPEYSFLQFRGEGHKRRSTSFYVLMSRSSLAVLAHKGNNLIDALESISLAIFFALNRKYHFLLIFLLGTVRRKEVINQINVRVNDDASQSAFIRAPPPTCKTAL